MTNKQVKDFQIMIERNMIPDLDLYMDQVRQLFDKTYTPLKRDENEKILTKTMINNYAKSKLLPPIENKKYHIEHVMLIQMIYQLKGALSLQDIQTVLELVTPSIVNETSRDEVYDHYVQLMKGQATIAAKTRDQLEATILKEEPRSLDAFYTIASLVQLSTLYRKMAETLIDDISKIDPKLKDNNPKKSSKETNEKSH